MGPVSEGVLVMAYGTPASLDDVEAYYTDIRGGRTPSPELVQELTGRYRAIGGRSPLLQITKLQAAGIAERLGIDTYVGQKHAAPFIRDAIAQMKTDGVERAAGLVMAPHYSYMSIGDYERRARDAAKAQQWRGELQMVPSWHLEDGFVDLLAARVVEALGQLTPAARDGAAVLFTAHSLPQRILEVGDPYPEQVQQTADAIARRSNLERWQVVWQSAGRTSVPWLGPDILEVLVELGAKEIPAAVVCPCGFVADHLEVLYDIDIKAAVLADELGMELMRTRSLNDDSAFLDVLSAVARRALDA